MGDSVDSIILTPLQKDLDVLPGFDRKQLKPSPVDILKNQVSVNEAFDINHDPTKIDPFAPSSEGGSITSKWEKTKNFCLSSFATRASDFAQSEVSVVFSKKVRDRLAELAVTSDEAAKITSMQQNEEKLREDIKNKKELLHQHHQAGNHWEMIDVISKACQLLINVKSPQFYPAQFMLVLDLVNSFGQMVYERISNQESAKGDYLTDPKDTKELLALNWSLILCRTRTLLPRLLLQTAFLPCVKFHPFKTLKEAITQITNAINGLGSATSTIYVRAYLIYTIYTKFPEIDPDMMIPLFTGYVKFLKHLKESAFKRQFNILDYNISTYLETHLPALQFFIFVMSKVGDQKFLKNVITEFFELGDPSAFVLGAFLDELPPSFVGQYYPHFLKLIDASDDLVPHSELIRRLIVSLTKADLKDGVIEIMNEIWNRMRQFPSVDDFVIVAAPMTHFITKFTQPVYTNRFLTNVVSLLQRNFHRSKSGESDGNDEGKIITKTLANSIAECIRAAVDAGKNFNEVLSLVPSVVQLMDFLDESTLVEISRYILTDISKKQFEMNDPLSIRILLEQSQILFQSLSVLSPVDIIEKTNNVIEWFLYRVNFGNNIEAHLSFLLSAREAFPTSSRLLSAISRIAFRLCANVFAHKPRQYDVITRSLLAFAFVTVPSVDDVIERTSLYLLGTSVALNSCVICFAHSFYDEFLDAVKDLPPSPKLYNMYLTAFNLLLVMPVKPSQEDPYSHIRDTIKLAVRIPWPDDEAVTLALESIILMAHTLRSEYVIHVENVDSNDVLYAGDEEFKGKAMAFIRTMVPRFTRALLSLRSKGQMAAKVKAPSIACRAMAAFVDVFACDENLIKILEELRGVAREGGTGINDLKAGVLRHVEKALQGDEEAEEWIQNKLNRT